MVDWRRLGAVGVPNRLGFQLQNWQTSVRLAVVVVGDAVVVLDAAGRRDGLLLDALAEVVGIVVAVLLQAVIPTSPYTVTIKTGNQVSKQHWMWRALLAYFWQESKIGCWFAIKFLFVASDCCGPCMLLWWNGWKCDGWGGAVDAVGWSQCSLMVGHVKHDGRFRRFSVVGGKQCAAEFRTVKLPALGLALFLSCGLKYFALCCCNKKKMKNIRDDDKYQT